MTQFIKFESSKYTFRDLFILIVKLRLTSVKKLFTNGRSVKTIQQSNDLIGLGSNCRLKKLTDSNAHNTIKRQYFESAITANRTQNVPQNHNSNNLSVFYTILQGTPFSVIFLQLSNLINGCPKKFENFEVMWKLGLTR